MSDILEKGSGAVEICKGTRFTIQKEKLIMVKDIPEIPYFSFSITLPKGEIPVEIPVHGKKVLVIKKIMTKDSNFIEKFYNMYLKNVVDCDRIGNGVFAHQPKSENLMMIQEKEQGIIQRYRSGSRGKTSGEISRMVVLEDEQGTVWAEKLGSDERRCVNKKSKSVYFFEIMEEK